MALSSMASGKLHTSLQTSFSDRTSLSSFRAPEKTSRLGCHVSVKPETSTLQAVINPCLAVRAALQDTDSDANEVSRRSVFGVSLAAAAAVLLHDEQTAVAITASSAVAGRIPGLSEPDADGLRTYKRPDGKSGGHGIGWSEVIPYTFKVPQEWEEVPVSIADLGGTEIDLRFTNSKAGNISVVVAPCLRFSDRIGNNARIEDVGDPEKVIYAFGPELTGNTVEGKVKDMAVKAWEGRTYYQYELDPHVLITATAAGTRLYILTVTASGRQWKKYSSDLKSIVESFRVG